MKNLYIVGGGGFGLELADYLRTDIRLGHLPHRLAGLFDYSPDNLVCRTFADLPYCGTSVRGHRFGPDDAVVVGVGEPPGRLKVSQDAAAAGVPLWTYVHSTAQVSSAARLGTGCVVCPHCIVNTSAELAENVLVNVFCSVGHGSRVGAHTVLSPYSSVSGNARVGTHCFLGTRATVFPRVTLGDHCTVDAHTAVRHDAPDRKIVSARVPYLVLDDRRPPPEV
jgi:sugar O-acyltransferase (sialic acid O-acetyltransferase NeuD family)